MVVCCAILEQYLLPFLEAEQYNLSSTSCRLHPDNDIFREQEEKIERLHPMQWQCGYCKKVFRAQNFLDTHFDNRHSSMLDTVCCQLLLWKCCFHLCIVISRAKVVVVADLRRNCVYLYLNFIVQWTTIKFVAWKSMVHFDCCLACSTCATAFSKCYWDLFAYGKIFCLEFRPSCVSFDLEQIIARTDQSMWNVLVLQSANRCLADLCGALHCDYFDSLSNSKRKKVTCKPAVVDRNLHLCEVIYWFPTISFSLLTWANMVHLCCVAYWI